MPLAVRKPQADLGIFDCTLQASHISGQLFGTKPNWHPTQKNVESNLKLIGLSCFAESHVVDRPYNKIMKLPQDPEVRLRKEREHFTGTREWLTSEESGAWLRRRHTRRRQGREQTAQCTLVVGDRFGNEGCCELAYLTGKAWEL